MNKVSKILQALKLFIKLPSVINLITNSDIAWKNKLNQKKLKSLPLISLADLVALGKTNTIQLSYLGGSSLATDMLLLQSVCQRFEHCNYFEIGTWRGESVMNVSSVASQCYTLNLSGEEMEKLGMSKKYADLHCFFSKNIPNITHLSGNSLTFNFDQFSHKFDVVFIDGNHTFEFVKNDTQKVFEHLLHNESIVVWHDYTYDTEQVRHEVLFGILSGVPLPLQQNLYQVSNTMCAIYLPEKMKLITDTYPFTPQFMVENQVSLLPVKS